MATVHIYTDEYYPFHFITTPRHGTAVEVDPVTLRRWNRILGWFEEVQEEMRTAREAAVSP